MRVQFNTTDNKVHELPSLGNSRKWVIASAKCIAINKNANNFLRTKALLGGKLAYINQSNGIKFKNLRLPLSSQGFLQHVCEKKLSNLDRTINAIRDHYENNPE